jgi:hypothetical protein
MIKPRRMRLARQGMKWKLRCAYKILFLKSEGKRPIGRLSHVCEDNIKSDHKKAGRRMWIGFVWPGTVTGGGLS